MTLPRLTYLTVDALADGVGASQVVPYLEALALRGLPITVHSFEQAGPDPSTSARLRASGVEWRPHPFGRSGSRGGLGRVARLAGAARRAPLVHARGDLAAAAAMLGGARRWVWDVRSFFADQRIELGTLAAGSLEDKTLRRIERRAARSADALVVLAHAALPVLEDRHGPGVAEKATVIPTCVDLDRFADTSMTDRSTARLLFSGSLNKYYDVPSMLRLVERVRLQRPTQFTVLAPGSTPWDAVLDSSEVERRSAAPRDVPARVRASHAGLSVCRTDVGDSLRAAMPTKIAEFLAGGRPVVVNAGLGDMDALLQEHRCGVVLRGSDDAALDRAARELLGLIDDPATTRRCRRLAMTHFNIENAADQLMRVYETAVAGH